MRQLKNIANIYLTENIYVGLLMPCYSYIFFIEVWFNLIPQLKETSQN